MEFDERYNPFFALKKLGNTCSSITSLFKCKKRVISFVSVLMINVGSRVEAGIGKAISHQLKVDVGARVSALGGCQFGSLGSLYSQFYNPALLATVSQQEMGLVHNEYLVDLRQEVFGYAIPFRRLGTFGVAANYFTYGTIDGYNDSGVKIGKIDAYDLVAQGSFGRSWNISLGKKRSIENFSLGLTFKTIQKRLSESKNFRYGLDLGFAVPLHSKWRPLDGIKMAGSVSNLSREIMIDKGNEDLPRIARFGFGQTFFGGAALFGGDAVWIEGAKPYPSVGIEYKLLKVISVRAGYRGDRKIENNLTAGMGFDTGTFGFDFAFYAGGLLEDTYRLSFVYRFGRALESPKEEIRLKSRVAKSYALYTQGEMLEAYHLASHMHRSAPWLQDNRALMKNIQRGFKELGESAKRKHLKARVEELFGRGEKFFKEGNFVDARLEFQELLGLDPDHKAAQEYIKLIELQFITFVNNFYQDGLTAFENAYYEKAKEEFEKVLVVKPDHLEAKAKLTECIEIIEKRKREKSDLEKKQVASNLFREAMSAYQKERYEEALSLFSEVLDNYPSHPQARNYLNLSNENLFKRYYALGQEMSNSGRLENAIENFRNALNYNPQSREAKEALASTQRKWNLQKKILSQNIYKEGLEFFLKGEKEKARSSWGKAIELDPENEEAKRGLSRITQ